MDNWVATSQRPRRLNTVGSDFSTELAILQGNNFTNLAVVGQPT